MAIVDQISGSVSPGQPSNYQEFVETTPPAAPDANHVRIYAEDNGAGKTQLVAKFPSGNAQQIAIEP